MTRRWIALAMVSALVMGTAAAQERPDAFPTRSIKIVVPFPAGGPSDVLARMIGQKMSEDWGQPVVVENRPGANTVLGAQQVAKAAPDGYTLLMAIDSTLTMNQYRTPPYDPFTDFVPVTLTAKTMQLLIVNAASDVGTVKELIAKAKIQPGKLNYGAGTSPPSSPGICSIRLRASTPCSSPITGVPKWPKACSPGVWIFLSTVRPRRYR